MHSQRFLTVVTLTLSSSVYGQQTAWGQCGGIGWSGQTTCAQGYVCTYSNSCVPDTQMKIWGHLLTAKGYSQCIPGTAATISTSLALSTTKKPSTTAKPSSTVKPSVTVVTISKVSTTTTATGGGTGPGKTLQPGYLWIRAVEAPNFHEYLQTSPQYMTGIAIMDDYTTAGQFNIVGGQLVELVTGGLLYAVVTPQSDSTNTKLAVAFSKSKNTYGTFAFSGDAVIWTVPGISRPNNAAWLVCANQQLFINLGPYAYNTPAGCADETIHYYNDATAVP